MMGTLWHARGARAAVAVHALLVIPGVLASCAEPGAAEEQPLAEQSSSLSTFNSLQLWSQGPIQICAESIVGDENQWFLDAVLDSWSQVINIDLWYTGLCSHSILFPNHIVLHFNQVANWTDVAGASGYGRATQRDIDVAYCSTTDCRVTNLVDYMEAFKAIAVHEMGHALGFIHEQNRPDNPFLDPADRDDNAFYLSAFDFDSVMLYGRGWDGHASLPYQSTYKGADKISALDAYGAQQLYGRRLPYWQLPAIALLR